MKNIFIKYFYKFFNKQAYLDIKNSERTIETIKKMQEKLVKQRGGSLSTILTVALPLISGLIKSLL